MSTEAGHRYTFGSPSKGWPTFGPDGKIVREGKSGPVLHEECGKVHVSYTPCKEVKVKDLMKALEDSLVAVKGSRR